jgi:adenosine kinase
MVPELRREFGGCAGNIAYNLKMLGAEGKPMATVGHDFESYSDWMDQWCINREYVKVIDKVYTAQAYITTDMEDNQITAFHPGAMEFSHHNRIPADGDIAIGIVSPDGREGMIEHAQQFTEAGIPFIFDPGQGLPMFDGDELLRFMEKATWATLNDYEAGLMQERTGKSPHELAEYVQALIVTLGGNGSHIYTRSKRYEIPVVNPRRLADPTGCGDAYRAGLLYGLMNAMDWDTTGRIASLMGAIKIETHGTQNHVFDSDEFAVRFKEAFKRSI